MNDSIKDNPDGSMELLHDIGWGSPLRLTLVADPSDPTRQQIVLSVPRMSARNTVNALNQHLRKSIRGEK